MPIVSVCPYCTHGRVRTSEDAIGTTARCPSCGAEFTVIPTDEPAVAAAGSSSSSSSVIPTIFATEDPPPKWKAAPPQPAAEVAAETLPDAPALADDADSLPDPARLPALMAVMVAVGGVVAWAIPDFGRLAWLGLAVTGLAAAGVAWLASDRSKLFPWIATGVSGGSVLFCLVLPSLFGEGWWPAKGHSPTEAVAVGFDGEQRDAKGGVDATKADWLRHGVRVGVREVKRGPVEVLTTGKKPQRKTTKEDVLQVVVEVSNDGAAGAVTFAGWSPANAAVWKTATGEPIPAKQFEPGTTPTAGPPDKPRPLPTGLSTQQTLYFELRRGDAGGRGELELPAAAFGGTGDPVRLLVPFTKYARPHGGNGGSP